MARKAVEALYDGICTVVEYQEYTRENKSTGFHEVVVLVDQPCRLSYSSSPATGKTESASKVEQSVKVFLAPELKIKPGSKLTITQNGVTEDYKSSGKPAVFLTHQEISLELFSGWA